ncbi:S41 family peptidase [Azospirillum sp. RWY-5-1]|uniref:S41 family peptidase n=1 Tax=Azospirillum oleiclasticum TaxID=2735135 RepID=A0ABX2TET5_9PROT|nr:S41 family peptidase [Azospirillum oleiclasticum]NYZ14164.1 S41 family peptidase [Azospirillum oleiclasticum]NYZ21648.1 S41 family peptidase [Azospirillum oleiclasticum]
MGKLLGALLLLVMAMGPACAVTSYESQEEVRALARYRQEFPKISNTRSPMSSYDGNYELFARVLDRVLDDHVKPQDPQVLVDRALTAARTAKQETPAASERTLTEAGLTAMMSSLDPYSSFLDNDHYRFTREQTQGEFGGLGIEVVMDDESGLVRVVAPIDGSPAATAGLKPGDLIARIDDYPVKGLKLHDAVARMRGPVGTSVALTLRRAKESLVRVNLTRAIVQIRSVRYRLEGDVGYIRIATFNQQTSTSLDEAVEELRRQSGGRLAGAVIDLRNNLGGLLDQAVSVSDRFLEAVDIVTVRGRKPIDNRRYGGTPGELLPGLPVVVVVNSGSASASEIVAGALQDHKRALVMGVRTYGKGSVQTLSPLPGDVGLRLTTARYYRPHGALVDCFGVTPDVEVRAANGNADEVHADPASCDPNAPPPPVVRSSRWEDVCPNSARSPATGPDADVPVQCAAEYIHARSQGAMLPRR